MAGDYLILGTFYESMEYLYRLRADSTREYEDDELTRFCNALDYSASWFMNKSRKANVIVYRRLFINFSAKTHSEVAKFLGMHHSTVIHHRQLHKDSLLYDKKYRTLWNRLKDLP
jgi:predicted methyltransferase